MSFVHNITIQPLAGKKNLIFLNRRLYESWKLSSDMSFTMICGAKHQQVYCMPENEDEPQLTCDPSLMQEFHLPTEPLSLRLRYDPEAGCFEIGPVIAVLTYIKSHTFEGPLAGYCEEMARYGEKQHALFYVSTLKDWRRHSVVGYYWQHGRWNRRELPQPNVVHNRIGQRKLEQLTATVQFYQSLTEKQIPYFNARFLDKWEVYEKLAAHPELMPYLPETVLYEDKASLENMLKRHACVFLKPAIGSQGKQIFRIHRLEDHLKLDYTTFTSDLGRRFSTFDDLYFTLESRLRRQPFIIQQGLSLIEHKGHPLDFRMLCNKGKNGNWEMTSAIARVSNEEQFVSNLAQGGASYPVRKVLADTFQEKTARQIRFLLNELALEAANVISLETEGIYGELGIDLALDQQGKPWIIEVNTKPSKDLDPEREPSVIRPSAKAVVDYSCFLSGFAKTEKAGENLCPLSASSF